MELRTRQLVMLAWTLAGSVFLAACAATGKTPIEARNTTGAEMAVPSASQPAPAIYRVFPGDELAIIAIRHPELNFTARVDPYGNITFPYLGQVNVRNLTPAEVGERLTRGLKESEYYSSIQLSVSFVESKDQFIYVLGEVKKPGAIAIIGNMTLLSAIGAAGGHTYDAEMSTVLWIRGAQSPPGVVKINMKALDNPRGKDPKIPNVTMIPGDVIFVPDTVIASVDRFMTHMFNILRPVVELEQGIVLYPSVETALHGGGQSGGGGTIINIITP